MARAWRLMFPMVVLLAPAARAFDLPILTFVTTGDSRVDPAFPPSSPMLAKYLPHGVAQAHHTPGQPVPMDPSGHAIYPFAFNYVQLKQTLDDVAALPRTPEYFFFTGDLVMGFGKGDQGQKLKDELAAFGSLLKSHRALHKTKFVLLPGNHETTYKVFKPKKSSGVDADDTTVWKAWLAANKFDALGGNGPGRDALVSAGGPMLQDDQSRSTYSFDDAGTGTVHFVVLNTDSLTSQREPDGDIATLGLFPLAWAKADIEKAQANPKIQVIFVVGHKPIRPPSNFKGAGPDDALNPEVAEKLREIMVANSKVKALICSHAHLWKVDSLLPKQRPASPHARDNRRPIQLVAGNSGCPLESFWQPQDEKDAKWRPDEKDDQGPYFGFTVVSVYPGGRVSYNSYQRKLPAHGDYKVPYYAAYDQPERARARPRLKEEFIQE